MKITGSELLEWVNNHWPGDDWYIDDGEIEFDDVEPEKSYDTADFGVIRYQGRDSSLDRDLDMAKLIRNWRRERDYEIVTISVPKSLVERVRHALAQFGVKINT